MDQKILLIEDEDDIRESTELFLENYGYKVYTASDGKQGLKLAVELKPDLIVCDIMMPGMNGHEVLKKLSENKITDKIPFLFLTAKVDAKDLRLGMELGADDYIFKPFRASDLLRAIDSRLKRFKKIKAELVEKNMSDLETEEKNNKDYIFIKANNTEKFLKIDDIKCIEAQQQYCNVLTTENKTYVIRKALSSWEKILTDKNFTRIHRSTIINLDYIEKIEKWFNSTYQVYLKGVKEPFKVSYNYAKKIKQIY